MATIPARVSVPERQRLYLAAALALVVEAGVLGGAYLMATHRQVVPIEPPPTVLSLVAAPAPAPVTAPAPAPTPAPEPKPVERPVAAAPHVTHAIAPRARLAAASPRVSPQPATPPRVAQSMTPTEPQLPVTPPSPSPAPAPAPPPTPAVQPPARPNASFEGALRAAIQAALNYPESARMSGMAGRTRVAFDYRDGVVSNVRVVGSSGIGLLDRAALAAVCDAAYPKPDAAFAGKTLSEQLWVTFNLNETE
ncbi:protein TonB [Paraburkholderia sp. GAS333]|uniref:TonB family protein n=1 Tax=Paraburkholderia sp. GAS333 TaxID=3156279 RepID=UPI003D1ECA42